MPESIIQMTPEQLDKALADTAAKAAAQAAETATKAAAEETEKLRQEIAKKHVPEMFRPQEKTNIKMTDENPHKFGTVIAAIGKSNLEQRNILDVFKDLGKEPSMYFNPDKVKTTGQNTGVFEEGGALVEEMYATEFIPLFKAASIFRKAGITIVPMVNGNMTYMKGTTASTAYWRGEEQKITKSKMQWKQERLSSKFLDAMVVVSDQLLRYASVDVAAWIEQDLIEQLTLAEDYAILYGTGTAFTPLGLFNYIVSANKNGSTGSTAATYKTDLHKCKKLLAAANVNPLKPIYVMHPTNKAHLEVQVDSNSNPMDYAKTLTENGKLFGAPVYETTQAYDTAYNTAYNIFYIDLSKIFIAQAMNMNVEFTKGGAYYDSTSATYIPGQVTGQSTFKCSIEEDIGIKYNNAHAIITGTTWGT